MGLWLALCLIFYVCLQNFFGLFLSVLLSFLLIFKLLKGLLKIIVTEL